MYPFVRCLEVCSERLGFRLVAGVVPSGLKIAGVKKASYMSNAFRWQVQPLQPSTPQPRNIP